MLGYGKLTNVKLTDAGLTAEVSIEGMTPAMVEAALEHCRVELALLTSAPPMPGSDRAIDTVRAAQLASRVESSS